RGEQTGAGWTVHPGGRAPRAGDREASRPRAHLEADARGLEVDPRGKGSPDQQSEGRVAKARPYWAIRPRLSGLAVRIGPRGRRSRPADQLADARLRARKAARTRLDSPTISER